MDQVGKTRIGLSAFWLSMIVRGRENFALNEAFFNGHSIAMAYKKQKRSAKFAAQGQLMEF
jgi:hypothetical protein